MYDLVGNNIDDFIGAYRDSLKDQYDKSIEALNQQRRNDQQSIMSNANTAGMLYSNFPQRDKIKYDTQTYDPALIKIRNTYQTGLDTLRSNAINTWNQIQSYQDAINHLNSLS